MSERAAYLDYVNDETFVDGYRAYQAKYAETPRESDRVLIELIDAALPSPTGGTVLDLGCSTGNLLRHLRRARPDLHLTGGDLMTSHLESCRNDAELAGVNFAEIDALDMGRHDAFDVVVMNAVFYLFPLPQLEQALANIARALRPGGRLIAFDMFHPFAQDLTVREASVTHPDGLVLHLRPYSVLREAAARVGLEDPVFQPFRIPIDLPRPGQDDDLISYTVPTADDERLVFRGALAQPLCHIVARRPA